MAYYGEYDSDQESNQRIYEYPPNSVYPPPSQSATQGGYGFNKYGGPAAYNKFNAGGGYITSGQQIIPQGQIVRVCSKANPDYALGIRDGRAVMLFYNPNDPNDPNDPGGGCQQIIPQGQIVRVSSKANPDYALGIRDGRAIMLFYNPNDPTLQWVKDESWSNRVRDQVGHPAFALVNKATGQALRHAPDECQEVLLTQYEGDSTYDENILWSESEDMGYGYRTVRMANNIGLNLDAFQGDRMNGGIRDGTRAVLWKWNKQDNQLWKLSPCY